MSNDAFQPEPGPMPPPGAPVPPPPGHDPYAAAFGPTTDPKKAKARLIAPGIMLILIGLLNLLPGFGCVAMGTFLSNQSDAQIEQAAKQWNAAQWEEAKKQGYTAQWYKDFYLYSGWSVGVASGLLALLTLAGGGCMIAGRSLFMCSIGALAAILSPGGCGILGLVVGIWAMVVLFSEEVRTALRAP